MSSSFPHLNLDGVHGNAGMMDFFQENKLMVLGIVAVIIVIIIVVVIMMSNGGKSDSFASIGAHTRLGPRENFRVTKYASPINPVGGGGY